MINEEKVILDLCSGTSSWSKPYKAAGYPIISIDLPLDVRLLEFEPPVYGILAAPPCTVFANCGACWQRTDEEIKEALSVVDACLRAVMIYKPRFWALENPVGKLKKFLGPPQFKFHPCEYGDPYTKKTYIWGKFVPPWKTKTHPTEGSKMSRLYGGKSERTKCMRSITPPGFARAFFEYNQ